MDQEIKCMASELSDHVTKVMNESMNSLSRMNSTSLTTSDPSLLANSNNGPSSSVSFQNIKDVMEGIVHPSLCVFGIIGNLLNIGVLFKHRTGSMLKQRLESVAITGLVGLAVSDMCYCAAILPKSFIYSEPLFRERNFNLVYLMYSNFFINIFVHNSTWLTAHTAIMRYIAICHPLRARQFIHPKTMILSFLGILIACILLNLPQCWIYKLRHYSCPEDGVNIYVLSQGYLNDNQRVKTAYTSVSFVLGFLVPICVLSFYNVHLIKELRASTRRRMCMTTQRKQTHVSYYITLTIIAVIFMFIVLITPSEIINYFFFELSGQQPDTLEWGRVLMVFCNLLQTTNFSCNFLLYCIVNPRFRHTVCKMLFCRRLCNSLGSGGIRSEETTGIQLNDVNGKVSL